MKRLLIKSLLFFFGTHLFCQVPTYSEISKKFQLNKEINLSESIKEEDLIGFDETELRLIRNEIFARKGYIFSSKDLQDHFNKFCWYEPEDKTDEILNRLNDIDKFNINSIKRFEQAPKDFKQFVSSFPIYQFPLSFNCSPVTLQLPLSEKKWLDKFYLKGYSPCGILSVNDSRVRILCSAPGDISFPIVMTYTITGELISEKQIFPLHDCAEDSDFSSTTNVTFKTPETIHLFTKKTENGIATTKTKIIKL